MRPFYDHAGITIYHGDCRDVLPPLSLGPCALVTDPPYGVEHESNYGASWQGRQIAGDGDSVLRDWSIGWAEGRRAPWAVFGNWRCQRPATCRGVLVWDKGPAFGMGDLSFPWKMSWEEIYIGGPGWHGRRDEGVLRGHIVVSWESRGRRHPHQKPVSLMAHILGKLPDDLLILDPFCGTGPMLVAAKFNGYRAVGIEIEERYCEIAARRLDQGVLPIMAEAII
jgi:DNA modification methylase